MAAKCNYAGMKQYGRSTLIMYDHEIIGVKKPVTSRFGAEMD